MRDDPIPVMSDGALASWRLGGSECEPGRLTSREPRVTFYGLKAMGDPEDDDEEEEEKKRKSEEDEEEDNEGEEKEVPWQVASPPEG